MTYNFTSPVTCNAGLLGPSLADVCSASTFVVFMSILNEFVRTSEKISGICERVTPVNTTDKEYDFVVIGAGAAGSAMASRLSEIAEWTVLLLEAGHDEPAGSQIPGFVTAFLGSEVDWKYKTTNESYACLSKNGSCPWAAGKTLGGSTAVNGMAYLRGNPTDYNDWVALGIGNWTWDEVQPYFLKSEDNREIDRVGRLHHSTGGPLSVERFPYLPPLGNPVLVAAIEAGYGITEDFNGDKVTGFSNAQFMSKHGVRRSSARAFLSAARYRKNLHVSLDSLVTRIIVENGTAVGVEYFKNGELRTVRAVKEVVLSAGTVRSPQIMLLSGIGPSEHLKSVGVEVVKNLPGVGENLQNHVSYVLNFTVNETDQYDNSWAAAAEYLAFQTGPLSAIGLATVFGTLASNATTLDHPDIILYLSGYLAGCAPGEIDALRSTGQRPIRILVSYTHAKSTGKITLGSKNALDNPVIWSNQLSDPSDVEGLLAGIDLAFKLAETKALKAHNLTFSSTPLEACSDHVFPSTEYWACAVHQDTYPETHQVGSCRMGSDEDPLAVVDNQLRVRGINGLRIVDGSVIPRVPSAPPAAAIIMIAERAADFIKNDWGLPS